MARKAFFTTPKTKNKPKVNFNEEEVVEAEPDPTGPTDESATEPTDSESVSRTHHAGIGIAEDAGDTSNAGSEKITSDGNSEGQVRLDHLPPPPDPS